MLLDNRMAEGLGIEYWLAQKRIKDQDTEQGRFAWNWRARRGIAPKPPKGLELAIVATVPHVHVINGKPHTVPIKFGTFVENGKKYTGAKLRELRAERGVGNPRKIKRGKT
jgi:hypothetical protein